MNSNCYDWIWQARNPNALPKCPTDAQPEVSRAQPKFLIAVQWIRFDLLDGVEDQDPKSPLQIVLDGLLLEEGGGGLDGNIAVRTFSGNDTFLIPQI